MNDDQEVVLWLGLFLMLMAIWLQYRPYLSTIIFGTEGIPLTSASFDPSSGVSVSNPTGATGTGNATTGFNGVGANGTLSGPGTGNILQ